MFTAKAKTVGEYLKQLPPDRRKSLSTVRAVVLENLPKGYEESIGWGAITYAIPLADYPDTYNGQPLCIAALSAGKKYCSIHLMAAYGDDLSLTDDRVPEHREIVVSFGLCAQFVDSVELFFQRFCMAAGFQPKAFGPSDPPEQ